MKGQVKFCGPQNDSPQQLRDSNIAPYSSPGLIRVSKCPEIPKLFWTDVIYSLNVWSSLSTNQIGAALMVLALKLQWSSRNASLWFIVWTMKQNIYQRGGVKIMTDFFFTSCSFKVMTVAQSSRDSNRLNPHDDLLTTTADDQKKYVKSANVVVSLVIWAITATAVPSLCTVLLCFATRQQPPRFTPSLGKLNELKITSW